MINLPQNIASINWKFNQQITSIEVKLTIEDMPILSSGNKPKCGIYLQLYDGNINKTGMYFGLQTNVMKPNVGPQGFGIIFSRWESGDENFITIAENGFSENSAHEGQFIGVRKLLTFIPGQYKIILKPGKLEDDMIWYELYVKQNNSNPIFCGALKFPLVKGENVGFDDDGGTWLELYQTNADSINEIDIPQWRVDIEEILADGKISDNNRINYPYEKSQKYSQISFENSGAAIFTTGPDIDRTQ